MFTKIRSNVLIVLVVSILVPRVNPKTTKRPVRVVTDNQLDNWKIDFICADLNGDGNLSVADRDLFKDRYVSAFNVDHEEKLEMEYSINFFWQYFVVGGNSSNSFSEDEFIDHLSKSYLEEKHFRQRAVLFQDIIHEIIDVDKDGKISKTEFLETYKDMEYKNRQLIEEFFNAFNPTHDKVPAKQMSRAWAGFFTGDHNIVGKYLIEMKGLQKEFKY